MAHISEQVLVLICSSDKECEVTGKSMGGDYRFECPVSQLRPGSYIHWTACSYMDMPESSVICESVEDDKVVLTQYNYSDQSSRHYPNKVVLTPGGEEWSSGWYCWGSWSYCHTLRLEEKK